jgi:hypothetical protein
MTNSYDNVIKADFAAIPIGSAYPSKNRAAFAISNQWQPGSMDAWTRIKKTHYLLGTYFVKSNTRPAACTLRQA